MTNVAVLIPNRSDGGRRDELLKWTTDRLASLHPDVAIHVGNHEDGPFNRSRAINTAAAEAIDAEVYVIADSDSFVGKDQFEMAVEQAKTANQCVLAYTIFNYLNPGMSAKVMDGFDGNWHTGVEWTLDNACSSMVAVPVPLFNEIGGCDEGFVGWGGEDVALTLALNIIGNGIGRIDGEVWHLWHRPATRVSDSAWMERVDRYHRAAFDKQQMVELLATLKGEL